MQFPGIVKKNRKDAGSGKWGKKCRMATENIVYITINYEDFSNFSPGEFFTFSTGLFTEKIEKGPIFPGFSGFFKKILHSSTENCGVFLVYRTLIQPGCFSLQMPSGRRKLCVFHRGHPYSPGSHLPAKAHFHPAATAAGYPGLPGLHSGSRW